MRQGKLIGILFVRHGDDSHPAGNRILAERSLAHKLQAVIFRRVGSVKSHSPRIGLLQKRGFSLGHLGASGRPVR